MGRVRGSARDWLVVVVPLAAAGLAFGAYHAWRWYERTHSPTYCFIF